jgi:NADH dehydrogenase (ubiquinone) Fe-S protein 1
MQRLRALRALQSRVESAWSLRGFAAAAEPAPAPAPPPDTIEVTVDGRKVTIPKGSNVIQACDAAGVDIPR